MDRGAARSKKRIQQLERAALAAKEEEQRLKLEKKSKPKTKKSQSKAGVDGRDDKPGGPSSSKLLPEPQSKDPELYRAKAIRSSNALIWPFQLPPASLDGITRVDMTNAGVEDISWLKSSQVRWLSLSGCPVKDWEAVGTLSELTVLNVNECGLDHLPKAFGNLTKLKAFVGMSNPWKKIDQGIISQWTELNSLIISHSPNLTSIPDLSSLIHLTKLTFSHCPRINSSFLPDLSSLPLLKDVKMNNLPLLTTLPPHLLTWGTGPMSRLNPEDSRKGQGLESIDVGSCSLDDSVLDQFKSARLPIMRSVTLHHNPFSASDHDYPTKLQAFGTMPKLLIVDNKRVVEKKAFDPVDKKKKKKNKEKLTATGSNELSEGGKKREWGVKANADGQDKHEGQQSKSSSLIRDKDAVKPDKKRKRDDGETVVKEKGAKSKSKQDNQNDVSRQRKEVSEGRESKKVRTDEKTTSIPRSSKSTTSAPTTSQSQATKMADPSALTSANAKRHSKNETGVFGVVDVASTTKSGKEVKNKGKKDKKKSEDDDVVGAQGEKASKGGIDLKEMFNKNNDNGLGVGGW